MKGQYRLLKDARKQSGVSWNYHTHMIDADAHLWQNLMTVSSSVVHFVFAKLDDLYSMLLQSFLFLSNLSLINHFFYIQSWPEISKFQNKPFPLYDKPGDLYDGELLS